MKTATMLFGWLFGFFSICCIVGTADYLRRNWVPRFSTFWALGAMVSLAIVFAMTWWTTWKRRRTARAWGVTASLTKPVHSDVHDIRCSSAIDRCRVGDDRHKRVLSHRLFMAGQREGFSHSGG